MEKQKLTVSVPSTFLYSDIQTREFWTTIARALNGKQDVPTKIVGMKIDLDHKSLVQRQDDNKVPTWTIGPNTKFNMVLALEMEVETENSGPTGTHNPDVK